MNDRERRTLAAIERQLRETDPEFVRRFTRLARRGQGIGSPLVLLALGMALLVVGSIATAVPIVLAGMVCALSALTIAIVRQAGIHRPMTA